MTPLLAILYGTTLWKRVVLPAVLYGTVVTSMAKTDIYKSLRSKNEVWRQTLRAQQTTLRKVGACIMEARVIEGRIKYKQYVIAGRGNGLLKRITKKCEKGKTRGGQKKQRDVLMKCT